MSAVGEGADAWAVRYVDRQLERAWLDLRLRLADRLAEGVALGGMEPVVLGTPDGDTVSLTVNPLGVVLGVGCQEEWIANVDEAAHRAAEILRGDYEVIDPAFLDCDLVAPGAPEADEVPVVVPELGKAQSLEELQGWVEAVFQASLDEPLQVDDNGDIAWEAEGGARARVSVRSTHHVEVWTMLATHVAPKRAHRLMDELPRQYPVRFFLVDDALVMSQVLDAWPFVPEHLEAALGRQLRAAADLAWVAEHLRPKGASYGQRPSGPDPALVALLASANRVPKEQLQAAVAEAAGTPDVLMAWRRVACEQWMAARKLPRDEDDPHDVNRLLRLGWYRLMRAASAAAKALEQKGDAA